MQRGGEQHHHSPARVWAWCLGEAPKAGLGAAVTQHLPWLAWDKNQATATQTASLVRYQPRAAIHRDSEQALSAPRTLVWLPCLPPAPEPGSPLWAALSRAPAPRGSRYRNAAAPRLLVPQHWSSVAFQGVRAGSELTQGKVLCFFLCGNNEELAILSPSAGSILHMSCIDALGAWTWKHEQSFYQSHHVMGTALSNP